MGGKSYVILKDRGVLSVSGPDARPFLQGLISNDIDKVAAARAIYATLLTPQGKFLHDFFISQLGEALLFDCESSRIDDLERRLAFYKLRANVTLERRNDVVAALFGDGSLAALGLDAAEGSAASFGGGTVYTDPRLSAAGARAIVPRAAAADALKEAGFAPASAEVYEQLRLAHALPDGSRDMPVEKGFLLENGIVELNGIDFDKGCYVGQELIARTKHRGTIRKRLYRVDVAGPLPAPGSPITFDGREAGVMRSGHGAVGLALLRIEPAERAVETGDPLTADAARLTPVKPAWAA